MLLSKRDLLSALLIVSYLERFPRSLPQEALLVREPFRKGREQGARDGVHADRLAFRRRSLLR